MVNRAEKYIVARVPVAETRCSKSHWEAVRNAAALKIQAAEDAANDSPL